MSSRIEPQELFAAIEHGDEDHRGWLSEAIQCFYEGRPVPPPRGKGTAEAENERIKAEARTLLLRVAWGHGPEDGDYCWCNPAEDESLGPTKLTHWEQCQDVQRFLSRVSAG